MRLEFDTLRGKTLKEVRVSNTEIDFVTNTGETFRLFHDQHCCEHVTVEDVCGDTGDLIGTEILVAEESTSYGCTEEYEESFGWTFYKVSTVKGSVTIRWYGESNGYYSVDVDFVRLPEGGSR